MEQTIKLHSLSWRQPKIFMITALLVAGNLIFPALCHLLPQGGLILLPIYFFTLLGAYKYGLQAGLLTGVLSPLVNHALTGMPPSAMLPAILAKSVLIAVAAAYAAKKSGKVTVLLLAAIVLFYQTVGAGVEWIVTGSREMAMQDFRLAVPGMLLQIFGVYAILLIGRKRSVDSDAV